MIEEVTIDDSVDFALTGKVYGVLAATLHRLTILYPTDFFFIETKIARLPTNKVVLLFSLSTL